MRDTRTNRCTFLSLLPIFPLAAFYPPLWFAFAKAFIIGRTPEARAPLDVVDTWLLLVPGMLLTLVVYRVTLPRGAYATLVAGSVVVAARLALSYDASAIRM